MAWLHNIIMVGGGLYLCWMGYQMLRGALKKEENKPEEPKVELATGGRSFVKGLLTNWRTRKQLFTSARYSRCLWGITSARARAGGSSC